MPLQSAAQCGIKCRLDATAWIHSCASIKACVAFIEKLGSAGCSEEYTDKAKRHTAIIVRSSDGTCLLGTPYSAGPQPRRSRPPSSPATPPAHLGPHELKTRPSPRWRDNDVHFLQRSVPGAVPRHRTAPKGDSTPGGRARAVHCLGGCTGGLLLLLLPR